jgi:hypothetical protein
VSYKYTVQQGSLSVTLTLDSDAPQPLLTVLAAFYYHHRSKALLDASVSIYQGKYQVLQEQVDAEIEKIKLFFIERRIIK